MKEITVEILDRDVTLRCWKLDAGYHVSVFGGDKGHIGAVAIVSPDGEISNTQFPTHKEGIISESFAKALVENGLCPAVVEAGVHYDVISPERIITIVDEIEKLKGEVLEYLMD